MTFDSSTLGDDSGVLANGMAMGTVRAETRLQVKRYRVQYPISAYTFPREARIHRVWLDDERMYVELTDGRMLSVPLLWIPTLYNAAPEEREKYEINPI
jgi:hypothetical protein